MKRSKYTTVARFVAVTFAVVLLIGLIFLIQTSVLTIKGTVQIGGVEYLYSPRIGYNRIIAKLTENVTVINGEEVVSTPKQGFRFITIKAVRDIELGIPMDELIEKMGVPNGELGYNGNYFSIFYKIGIDTFAVFHLTYGENFNNRSYQGRVVSGVYLYNHERCIEVIKEQESN